MLINDNFYIPKDNIGAVNLQLSQGVVIMHMKNTSERWTWTFGVMEDAQALFDSIVAELED